ncbi:MAG: type I glyceraldehyde-3-phosphate dehydrogenase [Parcubacteria group bacterium CG10_big_fil_rev_8_21_14_0_10_36_14]|nr:MAG: type I glyceraldehyde-3-phosphate dehydrogenase [Parcubacteria group bacterium CG10_big_fil_rev_8_21_14_0_10_36_14]
MIRVVINGFGRIGRNTFKAGFGRADLKNIEWVAVNDLTEPANLAYLLKHDTVYHDYDKKVGYGDKYLTVNGKKILVFAEKDPAKLPWKKLRIDVVLECTGIFRDKESAGAHIKAGAKKVIISAPSKGEGVGTYILGVNSDKYDGKEKVIDNGSCTTNCIAPAMAVLHAAFGVEKALMTTVHGYTADQRLVDAPHKDYRRGRTAGQNMIPTTTGAAIATTKTIPDLVGKFDGISIRVPLPAGSISDFTCLLKKDVTIEQVNNAFKRAAKNPIYKGILTVTDEPIVSSDILGNPHSSIIDLAFTKVIGGNMVKVLAWYDNEWGYSNRLIEMVKKIAK